MIIIRILFTLLAIMIILIGLVAMVSPIPFGILLIAIGLVILAIAAPGLVRWLRQHWGWLDSFIDKNTDRLPDWLARRLRDSDPMEPEDEAPSGDINAVYPVSALSQTHEEDRAKKARTILMK